MNEIRQIAVTGALGHIGSKFILSSSSNFNVTHFVLVDNMLTQRYCSLFNLKLTNQYTFVETDIMTCDLDKIFDSVDAVLHLAAITDAANSFENAIQTEEVNFRGTQKVAESCLRLDIPLIFLSTTSVYGSQENVVDEACSLNQLQPQSPYAHSKLKGENFIISLKEQGLKYIICRFGTIFGISPGMRFHTAINKFCYQAVFKQPLTVWKTAWEQVRPYLDLDDAVSALNFIIDNKLYDGEIYNLLTVNASVQQIVEKIQNEVTDLKVNFVDSKIMNQLSYHVLNEKFKNKGFRFNGSIEKGISDTLCLLKPFYNKGQKN